MNRKESKMIVIQAISDLFI